MPLRKQSHSQSLRTIRKLRGSTLLRVLKYFPFEAEPFLRSVKNSSAAQGDCAFRERRRNFYCKILFVASFSARVRAATATTSKIWCAVLLAGSWSWPQVAGTRRVFLIPPCPCILVRPCSINNQQKKHLRAFADWCSHSLSTNYTRAYHAPQYIPYICVRNFPAAME